MLSNLTTPSQHTTSQNTTKPQGDLYIATSPPAAANWAVWDLPPPALLPKAPADPWALPDANNKTDSAAGLLSGTGQSDSTSVSDDPWAALPVERDERASQGLVGKMDDGWHGSPRANDDGVSNVADSIQQLQI